MCICVYVCLHVCACVHVYVCVQACVSMVCVRVRIHGRVCRMKTADKHQRLPAGQEVAVKVGAEIQVRVEVEPHTAAAKQHGHRSARCLLHVLTGVVLAAAAMPRVAAHEIRTEGCHQNLQTE